MNEIIHKILLICEAAIVISFTIGLVVIVGLAIYMMIVGI